MNTAYSVLGLMSGTSADGLDIALCNFPVNGKGFEIIATHTVDYPQEMQDTLASLVHENFISLAEWNLKFSRFMAGCVNEFLKDKPTPDLVVSHGHTIFHRPELGVTYQLGHGGLLHQLLGIPVVSNLRDEDCAMGGQGAPLVPVGDRDLFSQYGVCLNLGGFANYSFTDEAGKLRAFDICALNFVLNRFALRCGKPFDEGGRIAAAANVNHSLWQHLCEIPTYAGTSPPSLGREWAEREVFSRIDDSFSAEEVIATYTHYAAARIADALRLAGPELVLVSGGGAFNHFLVEQIQQRSGLEIEVPSPQIVQFKEAIIFAWLGLLRVLGKPNVACSVTGAPSDISAGSLWGNFRK
jgi:anhydro-N-acetylmuramic acid kinase